MSLSRARRQHLNGKQNMEIPFTANRGSLSRRNTHTHTKNRKIKETKKIQGGERERRDEKLEAIKQEEEKEVKHLV